MWNEFIDSLQYLLLGYEPHAGVICQFLWREIEASAGNSRACWAALPGCEHDMSLVNAPGAKNARVGRSKQLHSGCTLCHCQVERPAIDAQDKQRSAQQCCQLAYRGIRYQHGGCLDAPCHVFPPRLLVFTSL